MLLECLQSLWQNKKYILMCGPEDRSVHLVSKIAV